MGYMEIKNLYKDPTILMFKECYALEKIHGTSAHIKWWNGNLTFFSGGAKYQDFVALFDCAALNEKFEQQFTETNVVVYGEAYGGKMQGMSKTYGDRLRFVVFEVCVGDKFLDVTSANDVATRLGLEFVHYVRCSTDLDTLDYWRDYDSVQSHRNGIDDPERHREGIVLRPLVELTKNDGKRIIAKHKAAWALETKTERVVGDKLEILTKASEIADEWVTKMRLDHVMDKFHGQTGMEITGDVIKAMIADIEKESQGEVILSREAKVAIGKKTANMYKQRLNERLRGEHE